MTDLLIYPYVIATFLHLVRYTGLLGQPGVLRRSDRWGRLHRFGPYEQETGFTLGRMGR